MSFSEHVMTRQVALYEEYKEQFPNIYRSRVADYLRPPRNVKKGRTAKTTESPQQSQIGSPACHYSPGDDVEMVDESQGQSSFEQPQVTGGSVCIY